uniref:Enoyl reductase (ER) domain-containing protein n=1 Tax=Echeneis naucrates TaxID=173247 RepID=A0A665V0Z0_ECHNA
MKGLYCRADAADAQPKFVIQETSLPEVLGSHQVRVQVKACGLSPLDFKVPKSVVDGCYQFKLSDKKIENRIAYWCEYKYEWLSVCLYVRPKPEKLSSVCVAAALRDALCAYTALHTHARMAVGHTLLVMDGASSFGLMCIQLASYHGVRVLTTSHSLQKHTFLEQLRPSVARVIQVYNGSSDLLPIVLEETGGLGVDIIIDSGVRLQEEEELKETKCLPHKHELISALGVGGHWVTSHQDLQLDPPDCRLLHLKSASVSFLNPETWTASSAQQGRYLHILKDILEKMAAGVLRPQPEDAVSLYEATVAMETVQHNQRKKAVVQL